MIQLERTTKYSITESLGKDITITLELTYDRIQVENNAPIVNECKIYMILKQEDKVIFEEFQTLKEIEEWIVAPPSTPKRIKTLEKLKKNIAKIQKEELHKK